MPRRPATGLAAAIAALAVCGASGEPTRPATAEGAVAGGEPRVRASLLVDLAPDARAGGVGVLFELDPGWHLYWRNPGDTGLAPRLAWDAPAGARIGEIGWPVPRAFREDVDLLTYGYEGEVLLAAPIRLDAPARRARLGVEVDVLVCEHQCVPARMALEAPLAPRAEPAERAAIRARFEEHAERVPPSALSRGVDVSLVWPAADEAGPRAEALLRVERCPADAVGCGDPAGAVFFPDEHPAFVLKGGPGRAGPGGGLELPLALERRTDADTDTGPGPNAPIRGVLALDRGGRTRAFEIAVAPTPSGPTGAGAGGAALLRAIVLGVLGGLLLNAMPCVLPVLAIKVFAVAELARHGRREVWRQAAAYTAGITVTMLALSGCVIGLRASGTAVGWGFHLQEPTFVAAVAAVLVVFAANLLGAFEIQADTGRLAAVGARTSGARRSFFDGLLAVVLATPCSAPFLGTAVGFAFASPAPVVAAVFLAIGIGLAAPFVAVAAVPGWSRFVPRAGPWMFELRRGLAFALLLTVVWLVWIVGRAAGADAMAALLVLLLGVAFLSFAFGLLQRARGGASPPLLFAVVAGVLLAGLDAIELRADAGPAPRSDPMARPWDAAAVAEAVSAGSPAFVYFTADWCLTCKVNEGRVLVDPRVREALAQDGYAVFRADWTRRDDAIRRGLARLGRAGVPVYALYRPGEPDDPQLLPEILSVDGLLDAARRVASAP